MKRIVFCLLIISVNAAAQSDSIQLKSPVVPSWPSIYETLSKKSQYRPRLQNINNFSTDFEYYNSNNVKNPSLQYRGNISSLPVSSIPYYLNWNKNQRDPRSNNTLPNVTEGILQMILGNKVNRFY